MHYSTKTYGHDLGISAAFRQPAATHSHCSKIHGYALAFRFVFGATALDERHWVVDFGGLKELKSGLVELFDHKTCIAGDDPELEYFKEGERRGVLDLQIFPGGVGCEMFAQYGFNMAQDIVDRKFNKGDRRVWVESCECSEHGANSAIYKRDYRSGI